MSRPQAPRPGDGWLTRTSRVPVWPPPITSVAGARLSGPFEPACSVDPAGVGATDGMLALGGTTPGEPGLPAGVGATGEEEPTTGLATVARGLGEGDGAGDG